MKPTKKGLTLQEGLNAVIIIGLIGLFMGFFAIFNDNFSDSSPDRSDSTVNETLASVTNTSSSTLTGASACGSSNFVVSACVNTSGGGFISSGNYTVSSTLGTLIGTADMDTGLIATSWDCSYTNTFKGSVCNISEGMNQEFENQVDILGLVLLAVFFGIAITALLASFMVRFMAQRKV